MDEFKLRMEGVTRCSWLFLMIFARDLLLSHMAMQLVEVPRSHPNTALLGGAEEQDDDDEEEVVEDKQDEEDHEEEEEEEEEEATPPQISRVRLLIMLSSFVHINQFGYVLARRYRFDPRCDGGSLSLWQLHIVCHNILTILHK